MELKRKENNYIFFKKIYIENKHKLTPRILLVLLLTFSLTFFSFFAGVLMHRNGAYSSINKFILEPYRITQNYFKSFGNENLDNIKIDIKFKNFNKLAKKRNEALTSGILISDEYVPAKVQLGGKEYKINIRLKGDFLDHLIGEKWSFRIKVKDEETILGMKQFSLHNPNTRNFIYEWIYHKLLKKEGLISLRYNFLTLTVNGKNLGIYALEEHFEKRLIENNERKEGPILRFDESLHFVQILRAKPYELEIQSIPFTYGSYYSSYIDSFQTSKILSDSIQFNSFLKGILLLESFRIGEKSTNEVFDVDKLSSFVALADIMGSYHSITWNNSRFYYNPITGKLEPIGFDSSSGNYVSKNGLALISGKNFFLSEYLDRLFSDPIFYNSYIDKLMLYSKKSFLDNFFNEIKYELNEKLSIIYKEWPTYYFDKSIMYSNQAYIRETINPDKAIHAFLKKKNNKNIIVSIANLQSLDVEVSSVFFNDSLVYFPYEKISIPGKLLNEPLNYNNYEFYSDININESIIDSLPINVNYEISGTGNTKNIKVFEWDNFDRNLLKDDFIRSKTNINEFKFIYINKDRSEILFKKGIYDINQNIHIPEGYNVFITEGTTLNLLNNSSIISKSTLILNGTEDKPIIIKSSDSSGQGIFVLNASKRSILNHVYFENLSNPIKNEWNLTGAITFYESDVSINNCYFINNIKGDDYLNIIRSDFSINNSNFNNIISDALDADFSSGNMSNNIFNNCGNDGIDISGTNLTIDNIKMNNIGDKGISSGEGSSLTASNVEINNSEIAICSKDKSIIKISTAFLNSNKIGITAFRKKPEFGPAEIIGSNIHITNTLNPFLIESKSKLFLDGDEIKSNNEKVKDLLYGVIYGKSSK
jgi:hypothetical protein